MGEVGGGLMINGRLVERVVGRGKGVGRGREGM